MVRRGMLAFFMRLIVFFVAFAIVVWFMLEWKIYSGEFLMLFLRTENWGSLVFLLVTGSILGKLLEILLQWFWHNEFVSRRRHA